MPPKGKSKDPVVPVRRSGRERKKATFGSDFEQEDPEDDPAAQPSKRAKQDPKPGTSKQSTGEPAVDPPLPSLDPDPPAPSKKVTWPSEPLSTGLNHNYRRIIVSDFKFSEGILNSRQHS